MAAVITGIGARTPLGCRYEECMDTLRQGTLCIDDIQNFKTDGYEMKAAGEIRSCGRVVHTGSGIDRKVYFFEQALGELDAKTAFSKRYKADELVLNVGGGVDYFDIDNYARTKDISSAHFRMNADMQELCRKWNIGAGCHLFSSACTASAQAIGLSLRMLRKHTAGAVVTGGADSMISPVNFLGFFKLGALSMSDDPSPYKCKPMDLKASGTVLGEASVAVMLEDSSRVPADVPVLAELCGYGCSMDAFAVTEPEPTGEQAARAVAAALEDAGISADQIDCIHLHGTGTPKCAPAEYNCLYSIFGERLADIPVYSMKGQVGHMIGSCTSVELMGIIHSLEHQEVLPTVNFTTPNPKAPFHVVTGEPLKIPIRYILKLNSAFGGHNTALIFKKWER